LQTHVNPTFVWKKGKDEPEEIHKGQTTSLEDGDAFSLLIDKYKYGLSFENDGGVDDSSTSTIALSPSAFEEDKSIEVR
jgi:hypothetical protein